MIQKTIAIDGACRRNGAPTCISAGACFIVTYDTETGVEQGQAESFHEEPSTSQRGELNGLLQAIEHVHQHPADTIIITDSEYLFNTMTKRWVDRWLHNNWTTAQGEPTKNADLWKLIWKLYLDCENYITFFHLKGHLLSVGQKKCHELLYHDTTGYELYEWARDTREIKEERRQHANDLSMTNNGFTLSPEQLQQYAAMNLVADAVANLNIEIVESAQWQSLLNRNSPIA